MVAGGLGPDVRTRTCDYTALGFPSCGGVIGPAPDPRRNAWRWSDVTRLILRTRIHYGGASWWPPYGARHMEVDRCERE